MPRAVLVDDVLSHAGTGPFHRKILAIFGLVWAADAMQVLAVGFTAASIAASFDLTLPQALQTGTLFFLGMMIGAAVFGRLADHFGRRSILIFTVSLDVIFGIASVFAQDFTTLLVLRFLTGLAVGGTLPVDYALLAEFLPPKTRGRWLVGLEAFWAVGTLAVALVAWIATRYGVVDIWRVVFLSASLPAIIGLFLRLRIPESPLYLLQKGRDEEARAVLSRVLVENGRAPLGKTIVALPEIIPSMGLFTPSLRRNTVLILSIWFLVALCYYGIFTWMPAQLAGQGFGFVRGYGFLVLLALAQLPGYALAAWGVERFGRKPTLAAFLVLSALGCASFSLASDPKMIGASLLMMSFALLGTWGGLYAYTPELFPTPARASGMGTASAMARFGGLLAPSLMGALFIDHLTLAIGLFAALLLISAVLTVQLRRETRGQGLS